MCGVHLGWMECFRCNSRGKRGETSKWQWLSLKLGPFRIHKLEFEFISWISKSFRNGSSTLRSCLLMAITFSFQLWFAQRLKRWTLDSLILETTYIIYKMDSIKWSKFFFKFVAIRFWVLNFHAAESCFMRHFLCFIAFFLTP